MQGEGFLKGSERPEAGCLGEFYILWGSRQGLGIRVFEVRYFYPSTLRLNQRLQVVGCTATVNVSHWGLEELDPGIRVKGLRKSGLFLGFKGFWVS